MQIQSKKTIRGNRVKAFVYEEAKGNTMFVVGRVHGNEPEGEYIIKELKRKIEGNLAKLKRGVVLIPCFNPDGKELNIRGNGRAVDLNRNYDTKFKPWSPDYEKANRFPGESAESEVETQFLVELTEKYQPTLVFAIHSPLKNINYDGGEKAKRIATQIADYVKYPVVETIEGQKSFNGSMGGYFGYDRDIPIVTIETESCAKDDYLKNFKKVIGVKGREEDGAITDCMIKVKELLDEESLMTLYFNHGKVSENEQDETNIKIKELLKNFSQNVDFNGIRKVYFDGSKTIEEGKKKILQKFVEVLFLSLI